MLDFNPKVTVVIPVYNGAKYLKKAINSALEQTYKNIEIIVVNDGSRDKTEKIALSYGNKIRYIKKENGGVSSALNLAIKNMTGEYFSWLSHDDIYYKDKIEEQIKTLIKLDNKKVVLYSNFDFIDSKGRYFTESILLDDRLLNFENKPKNEFALLKGCINGITMLIPKEAFENFGGFDETLKCTQDYDKWLQLIIHYDFIHISNVLVATRLHKDQDTNRNPNVLSEGNVLWKKIYESFNDEKKIDLCGSVENYYKEAIEFLSNSPYKEALSFFQDKLSMICKQSKSKVNNKIDFFYPKVSIIIPVYNGSNYLKEAIESALDQTYKNIEIIVVNDGSTDNGKTEKIALSYRNKIRYFKKENGGVASALNLGIKKMTGEYFSWLSHDDVYYLDKIENQIKKLSELSNKKTILYSNVEYINETSKTISKTQYENQYSNKQLNSDIYPVIKGLTNGCSMLIPKDLFVENGYFDEKLMTTNDYDMWFRLYKNNKIKFMKIHTVKYRLHEKQGTNQNPHYFKESNILWGKILNFICNKHFVEWGITPLDFYFSFYNQMKNSGYFEVAGQSLKLAKKEYDNKKPNVSIIMPCYNSEKYIEKAISSILCQTYSDFELIIVNDGSTDKTVDIIKKYIREDFRIILLNNKYKKGVSGAMNTGLDISKGNYITRMDSDDISVSDRIQKQVSFLEQNPDFGICSVNISYIDENDNVQKDKLYNFSNDIPIEWQILWKNPIPNAPIMYRKELIRNNKSKFKNLKTAEDYDFLIGFVSRTKIHFLNESLYLYRKHPKSLFQSNFNETINNSYKISRNHLESILDEPVPNFYKFLTDFYFETDIPIIINYYDIYKWLLQVAKKFKMHYKWNDDAYENVIKDIFDKIGNYAILVNRVHSNSTCNNCKEIMNSNSWKITKPLRLITKWLNFLKNNGIIETVKALFQKIYNCIS